MTSKVDVSYKARRRRLPTITFEPYEGVKGRYLVEMEGHEPTYAADLEELEVAVGSLYEREDVRLSYKRNSG